jgi:hypothetical protein
MRAGVITFDKRLGTGSNGHQAGCVILSLGVWPLWRWKDKPSEPVATLAGMVLESFVLALPLLALARAVALWGNTTVPGTALHFAARG